MYTKNRIVITLPKYLRTKLIKKSKELECSQAEIIRISFIKFLEADK